MRQIEELFLAYKADVFRYLVSLTRNAHAAEDLLSDTFLAALTGLHTYREDASVKTWLFGIARNQWLQSLRKKRPTASMDDLLGLYVGGDTLPGQVDARLAAARALELLVEKGERPGAVVRMRAQGYAYAEIGAALGVTENSARVIEFRTKNWLQSRLREEGLLDD